MSNKKKIIIGITIVIVLIVIVILKVFFIGVDKEEIIKGDNDNNIPIIEKENEKEKIKNEVYDNYEKSDPVSPEDF